MRKTDGGRSDRAVVGATSVEAKEEAGPIVTRLFLARTSSSWHEPRERRGKNDHDER